MQWNVPAQQWEKFLCFPEFAAHSTQQALPFRGEEEGPCFNLITGLAVDPGKAAAWQ